MILKFKSPTSSYTEFYNTSTAWLWCLLFGWWYWAARRNYFHAVMWFVLIFPTFLLSAFVYPFIANKINMKWYARNGWEQVL